MQWYLKVLKNYANFNGRARRKEYWFFRLFDCIFFGIPFIATLVTCFIYVFSSHSHSYSYFYSYFYSHSHSHSYTYTYSYDSLWGTSIILFIILMILIIYKCIIFIPKLAVTVRRLHDTERSGWWILIILVPFFGKIWLFILTVLDSTPSTNKYGENPKEEPSKMQSKKQQSSLIS